MAWLIISLLYITTLMTIVASINCQGLRSADRRKTAFSFFTRSRFDIIFLQETHWTADMEIELHTGNVTFPAPTGKIPRGALRF